MISETFDCVDCGAAVPRGRLSCPTCGALLASVTGGPRDPSGPSSVAGPHRSRPVTSVASSDVAATSDALEAVRAAVAAHAAATAALQADAPGETDGGREVAEPPLEPLLQSTAFVEDPDLLTSPTLSSFDLDDVEDEGPEWGWADVDAGPVETSGSSEVAAVTATVEAADAAAVPIDAVDPTPAGADLAPGPSPTTSTPAPVPAPADLAPRPYQAAAFWRAAVRIDDPAPRAPVPAAYRPPTLAMATAAGGATWPGVTTPGGSRPTASTSASGSTDASTSTAIMPTEAARFAEIAGWFVVVGATMSLLGFLLPWSRVVIGARATGGYLDTWGLASPTHLLVVIGLLVVLGLGVMRTRVPTWLSTGVLGLAAGGLLLGLSWPYIVGPLGAGIGVLVVALGGIALLIGGALGSWATRHVEDGPGV